MQMASSDRKSKVGLIQGQVMGNDMSGTVDGSVCAYAFSAD